MTRTITVAPTCRVLTVCDGRGRKFSTTDTKWTRANWDDLTTCDPADIDTDDRDLWDDESEWAAR